MKRQPLFIYCVAFSEEKQGASKCRNLIHGTIRRHSCSLCLKDKHLAPLPFPSTYLQIHASERNIRVLGGIDAAFAAKHSEMHNAPERVLKHATQSFSTQIPSETQGAYVDFGCIQIKQVWATFRTEPSVPTQRVGWSSWLVLGNKPVIGQFKDGGVGLRKRPRSKEQGARSQDRRLFTAPWLPSGLMHSDTCLGAVLALGKENRK